MRQVQFFLFLAILILNACSSQATQSASQFAYPLDTKTGIPNVDNVLSAVASGDPAKLRSVIGYTEAPCTRAEGLGGPPKCQDGEVDGTVLEVLPFIGSEGGHIRKSKIDQWPGIQVNGLYAVYRVSENALHEEYYPPGDYIAFFTTSENQYVTALRIANGGIVRVDTLFGEAPGSLEKVIERDTSEVILAPKSR